VWGGGRCTINKPSIGGSYPVTSFKGTVKKGADVSPKGGMQQSDLSEGTIHFLGTGTHRRAWEGKNKGKVPQFSGTGGCSPFGEGKAGQKGDKTVG